MNWKLLVEAFFEISDPSNEYRHIVNPGATEEAISAVEKVLGITLPDELRSFYRASNGIGMTTGEELDEARFILPVESLPDFVKEGREPLEASHPEHAARFVPFLDFENGDLMAYMLKEDGTYYPFLVKFCHENYENRAEQDINEFLAAGPDSLTEFFPSL